MASSKSESHLEIPAYYANHLEEEALCNIYFRYSYTIQGLLLLAAAAVVHLKINICNSCADASKHGAAANVRSQELVEWPSLLPAFCSIQAVPYVIKAADPHSLNGVSSFVFSGSSAGLEVEIQAPFYNDTPPLNGKRGI